MDNFDLDVVELSMNEGKHIVYKMFIFKAPNIYIFVLKFYYLEFIEGGNV